MESTCGLLIWSTTLLLVALILLKNWRKSEDGTRRLPPGPPGWPIFGNILDLGTMPHQSLYKLKFRYGPVLWLKLGSMNTMVIQSADAAAELFKNHDAYFCDRKCLDAFTVHDMHTTGLATNQCGPYWQMLRRLYSVELMCNKRITETASVRRKCIDKLIQNIEDETGEVNLAHSLFMMAFNVIGNLTVSRDLLDSNCKEGHQFYKAMDKIMVWAGTPNVADVFPFLKWLDPQRIRKNMECDLSRAMEIVTGFLKERIKEQKLAGKEKAKDFLDVLLEYEGDGNQVPEKISFDNITKIIVEMFLAGSETTSTAIEWAMTELLSNSAEMRKVQEELDQVVGRNRTVEESDIDNLPYLQAVVKETLRLHPPIPLMIPRNTRQDTKFMGYHIPKDTQVLVNVWAIGRDADSWNDPWSFKPERFLGSGIAYKGQNFELLPFGSGRRICVGLSLAHKVIHHGLASLLHSFDWELVGNSETADMNERMGITVRKLRPLTVIAKKCP